MDGGIDDLTRAAEAVRAYSCTIEGASPRALTAALQELERLSRVVEAALVGLVGEADRSGAFVEDGHASVSGWCRAGVRWSDAQITSRVRCARLCRALPQVGAALAEAVVGTDQVRELARVHANPRVRDQFDEAVAAVLMDQASTLDFADFRVVVRRWEQLADVDGATRDDEVRHDRRDARVDWVDGALHLRGRLAAAQGSWVAEVFEAFCQAEWHADWEQARARWGDAVTASMLERTAAQRRADAFWAMCNAAATAPPDGAVTPTVNIVIDADTFQQAFTTAVVDGGPTPVPSSLVDIADRRCETLGGAALVPADVVAAALVGHVRRVVVDSAGVVVDLGRRSRLFVGPSREAVWLRRLICCWVGCRSRHCEVDHAREWSTGGATDQHNAQPECGRHNRWKQRGIRPRFDPATRTWTLVRPDGSLIRPI